MKVDGEADPLFRLTGLSAADLADTLAKNPRAYMSLKGAVAEKHLRLYLERLTIDGSIESFRPGAGDFEKDFYIRVKESNKDVVVECKNVQVITLNTNQSKREYIEFLYRNQYITPEQYTAILPPRLASIRDVPSAALKDVFRKLPLELRESGLPRYAFSREICGIDSAPALSRATCASYLALFQAYPLTVDFQRTRNSRDSEEKNQKSNRYYEVGEIDVLAACLFSRTLEWQFLFCKAEHLIRHNKYNNRFSSGIEVDPSIWRASLTELLGS